MSTVIDPRVDTSAFVDAVLNRLQGQLPALCTGLGIPKVEEFLDYDPALPSPSRGSQLWVVVTRETPTGPAGFGGPNAMFTLAQAFSVVVTACGPDASEAQSRLYSYAGLVRKVMQSDLTVSNYRTNVRWMSTEYTANWGAGVSALWKAASLRFECQRWGALGKD